MAHTNRGDRHPRNLAIGGARHVCAAAAIAALSVGAGACSSSSKPASVAQASSTTASTSGASTSSESTTTATSGKAAAPVAVCTTLPTSQVATLSGSALTTSREADFAGGHSYTCDYFTATGTGGMSVTVTTVGGAVAYQHSLQTDTIAHTENVKPLTGLGTKAFSANDGVHALFGDRLIYVARLTTIGPAEAIVRALQAKLS